MADLPGGESGLLARDSKGKEADRLVTRSDPGVVAMAAELGGRERQAAEESGQGKTRVEERKPLDALPAAITLAMISDRRPRPGSRLSPPSTRRAFPGKKRYAEDSPGENREALPGGKVTRRYADLTIDNIEAANAPER